MCISKMKRLFRYDVKSGHLYWRSRSVSMFKDVGNGSLANQLTWNKRWAGKRAGTINNGYYRVTCEFGSFAVHRIIWAIMYGQWPSGEIDHINHNRSDNRISNLRQVSPKENRQNSSMYSSNISGVFGVHKHSQNDNWVAQIRTNGKTKHIGSFTCLTAARVARKLAEIKYGFHKNQGGVLSA